MACSSVKFTFTFTFTFTSCLTDGLNKPALLETDYCKANGNVHRTGMKAQRVLVTMTVRRARQYRAKSSVCLRKESSAVRDTRLKDSCFTPATSARNPRALSETCVTAAALG